MRAGQRRAGAHLFILGLPPHYARSGFFIPFRLDGEKLRLAPDELLKRRLSLIFFPHWALAIFNPANILDSNLVSLKLKFDQFRV